MWTTTTTTNFPQTTQEQTKRIEIERTETNLETSPQLVLYKFMINLLKITFVGLRLYRNHHECNFVWSNPLSGRSLIFLNFFIFVVFFFYFSLLCFSFRPVWMPVQSVGCSEMFARLMNNYVAKLPRCHFTVISNKCQNDFISYFVVIEHNGTGVCSLILRRQKEVFIITNIEILFPLFLRITVEKTVEMNEIVHFS